VRLGGRASVTESLTIRQLLTVWASSTSPQIGRSVYDKLARAGHRGQLGEPAVILSDRRLRKLGKTFGRPARLNAKQRAMIAESYAAGASYRTVETA